MALVASVDFGLAVTFATFVNLCEPTFVATSNNTIGFYAMFLVIHLVMNLVPSDYLSFVSAVSVFANIICLLSIFIGLFAYAPSLQSTSAVATTFVNNSGFSDSYCAVLGCLVAGYTFTGYEASSSIAEETHQASTAAPIGIVTSVLFSIPCFFFLLLALLFASPPFDDDFILSGNPFTQVLISGTNQDGAKVLLSFVVLCQFCCGFSSMTSSARVCYAFARDGGMPASRYLSLLSPQQIPYFCVILVTVLAFALGCTYLGQPIAFTAFTSLTVIGLNISYGIPIALRVWQGKDFKKGKFNLGPYGEALGTVACLYIVALSVVLVLPQTNPVNDQTMNYTVLFFGAVVLGSVGAWVVSAHKWFIGPPIAEVKGEDDLDQIVVVEVEMNYKPVELVDITEHSS